MYKGLEMFINCHRNRGKKIIKIIMIFYFFILGCLLFTISQKDIMYLDCNKEQKKCIVGEIKNHENIVNREIKYSEIKGYYLYNSSKGYFSRYDNRPNTTFVLKITQNNNNENLMLPFVGRIDWLQADKIYKEILNQGLYIKQQNHYKQFWLILSFLSFMMFFGTTYSLLVKKESCIEKEVKQEKKQEFKREHPKVKQQRKIKEIQEYIESQQRKR